MYMYASNERMLHGFPKLIAINAVYAINRSDNNCGTVS